MSEISSKPCRILVFTSLKRLIAIFHSINAAAKAMNVTPQSIHYVCTGAGISAKGYYFRTLQDNIEVTPDDFGTLRLEEYDALCGVERKMYRTKQMNRTNIK